MKRVFFIALFLIVSAGPVVASDFSFSVNITSNWGSSDFFQKSQLPLVKDGMNYLESVENRLGFGYSFSLNIPVMKGLFVVPGFSYTHGHQKYLLENQDDPEETPESNASYFKLSALEIGVLYDLLDLKNGWKLDVRCGLNYNKLKAGEKMNAEDHNYWGFQIGVGAKFLELKHLGFQLTGVYRIPFDSTFYSYFSGQFGLLYKI